MAESIIEQINNLRFSTTPLFKVENRTPIIQGTCSFIKYKSYYYILTAAHVIRNLESKLYISIEFNSKSLYVPEGKSYTDEKNDIAVILINEETRILIQKTYTFIEINLEQYKNKIFNNYSFIGFPESRGRYNEFKEKQYIEPFIYTTKIIDEQTLSKYQINHNDKICVYYDKNKVHNVVKNELKTGPDLYGISGCILVEHNDFDFRVAGILTDWFLKNRTILIGTRFILIEKILSYSANKNYIH